VTDEPTPDADFAAQLARINARRTARGLAPIVERDPDVACRELRLQRAAGQSIAAVLHGLDDGIAQAFDAFEAEADPLGLPAAVAELAVQLVAPDERERVAGAAAAVVDAWRTSPQASAILEPGEDPAAAVCRIRGSIELAVWRVCDAVTRALTDVGVDNLRERLGMTLVAYSAAHSDDPHYEDRLRRAACQRELADQTAATGLHRLADRLARAENELRPWLPPLHVFERVGPIKTRHPDPADRDALIADLRAELALLADVPYLPGTDEPLGGTDG
jgi:hypothetical protein